VLDVHPPHEAAHTWTDFLIHIANALQKHVLLGYSFGRFANEFPERPHTITWDTIRELRPTASQLDPAGMADARKKTADRLEGANAGADGTRIDPNALH
jgi:hypothetical protein